MIDTLETRLEGATANAEQARLLCAAVAAFEQFREFMPSAQVGYSRTLLHKRDDLELVAMRWEPGAVTPIHDHGDSRCWVAIIHGTIDVESYDRTDPGGEIATLTHTSSCTLTKGDLDHRLGWRELHRVSNLGSEAAYTIQLYAGPISEYVVIDETTNIVQHVFAKYDALYDLKI